MSAPPLRIVGSDPQRRAGQSAEITARTGLDEAMIERLVRRFYGRVGEDPVLGPIFDQHVDDWESHIARLCDFWSSVALMTGRYHGTPMSTHMALPLRPDLFDRWLGLFGQAARETCPEPAAQHVIERAERIANSLELGIAAQRGDIVPPRRPAQPGTEPDGGGDGRRQP
jgi:hemoglobin